MTKRPGTTSDSGVIFKKMNENKKRKEKKNTCGRFLKWSYLSTFIHLGKHLSRVLGILWIKFTKDYFYTNYFKFHALKCAFLSFFQKSDSWLDWPWPVSAALQNGTQDLFFSFISLFIFIFLNMKPLSEFWLRSSTWSFGHSDPALSCVRWLHRNMTPSRVLNLDSKGLIYLKRILRLPNNQHTQRKLLNFEFWIHGELSKIEHNFSDKVIKKWFCQKMCS